MTADDADRSSDEGDASPENFPTSLVPALTEAALHLSIPSGKSDGSSGQGLGLALRLSGTLAERTWTVRLASARAPGENRVSALLAHTAVNAGMSDLPVVGSQIPAALARLSALSLAARSGVTLTTRQVKALQALMAVTGGGAVPLEAEALAARMSVGALLELAGKPLAVWGALAGRGALDPSGQEPAGPVVPVEGGGSVQLWKNVDRALGPLHVRRVGVVSDVEELRLLLDASLNLQGVAFEAIGVGLALSLDGKYRVRALLDGLALAYAAGAVEVAGAFARDSVPPKGMRLAVSGLVAVTTPQISFVAAGLYAELSDGSASVFLIGQVSGLRVPLGPVTLTGLIGGFGYNSALRLPATPAEVPSFPLVGGLQDSKKLPVKDPAQALAALRDIIPPTVGSLWLAAGAELSVFETLKARLTVAVQVAPDDVTVALLGVATAKFPQKGTPYACLTLGFQATYRTSTGEIALRGALDEAQSYLVHPDCRLRGAFAVCVWTAPSTRSGDFVVSLGGYHPAYRRPSHYPEVERIGFTWAPGAAVSVHGECYAALTPSMAMVGGRLRVDYWDGSVRAWLDAHLDASVQWEPFRFDVDLGIRVGAEFTFCGTHRVELGATLTLWGPPTGGLARVHLPLVPDIVVRFGAGRDQSPVTYLDWAAFHARVLGNRALQAEVTHGLLAQRPPAAKSLAPQEEQSASAVPQVGPDGFSFALTSPLPCPAVYVATGASSSELLAGAEDGTVHVRPMDISGGTAPLTFSIIRASDSAYITVSAANVTELRQGVPASAFGPPLSRADEAPDPRGNRELLPGTLTGIRVTIPGPTRVEALAAVSKKELDHKTGASAGHPLSAKAKPSGPVPVAGTRSAVATTLKGTSAKRQAVLNELRSRGLAPGTAAAEDPTDYRTRIFTAVTADPLTATSETNRS
ncbi:DUF6603 domain-containing protein [Streptomyces carpaticus]|uniref:DUF6603 domain-containing protein n=1 Tax=Streptomyces carpaticus TaxID=285558 RepID=A0ABV4ZP12_9ACTN